MASAVNADLVMYDFEGFKIAIQYGDHSSFLVKVVENLRLAANFAGIVSRKCSDFVRFSSCLVSQKFFSVLDFFFRILRLIIFSIYIHICDCISLACGQLLTCNAK